MAGFRKAKPQQAALKIGIFGPAGSGKSFTSLLIGEGLAKHCGKRVAYIDTEHGTDFYAMANADREYHPEAFDFDALYTKSITEYAKEVRSLDPEVYGVVITDSITHFWEAARQSYNGPTGAGGQIPIHAWGKIKKPYKDVEAYLLNSPFHVITCGRQGVIFGKDEDTGELESQGFRMKAEGETPYEPHILLRMFTKPTKAGRTTYSCLAEKDRSGTLAGRIIDWPNYEKIAVPVLKLLGLEQAQVQTGDEAGMVDRDAMDDADREKEEGSAKVTENIQARYTLCDTWEKFDEVNKSVTQEIKQRLTPADQKELRSCAINKHEDLERQLGPKPVPPANKGEWIAACADHALSLGIEGHEGICAWAATKDCIDGMTPGDLLGTKTLSMLTVPQLKQLHGALLGEMKG